ncbi:hypothetical protein T261_8045 [Streptomyces lydicus]|nr:hypothetical protein T261_8045 [Streptomyces lydicus]
MDDVAAVRRDGGGRGHRLRQPSGSFDADGNTPGLPVTASHSAFAVSADSSMPSVRPGPTSP